jgi:hypothetical protein
MKIDTFPMKVNTTFMKVETLFMKVDTRKGFFNFDINRLRDP